MKFRLNKTAHSLQLQMDPLSEGNNFSPVVSVIKHIGSTHYLGLPAVVQIISPRQPMRVKDLATALQLADLICKAVNNSEQPELGLASYANTFEALSRLNEQQEPDTQSQAA